MAKDKKKELDNEPEKEHIIISIYDGRNRLLTRQYCLTPNGRVNSGDVGGAMCGLQYPAGTKIIISEVAETIWKKSTWKDWIGGV